MARARYSKTFFSFLLFFILVWAKPHYGQERLQSKIDSLDQVISRTQSQDSLVKLLSSQLILAYQIDDDNKIAEVELKIASYSNYDGLEMESHAKSAFNIYGNLNDTSNMISALYQVAYAKQLQNDYDSTRFFTERFLELAENNKDTLSLIKGRLMLSSIYNHLALYPQSLKELNKSKILAESTKGNETVVIDILNRESFIFYSLEQFEKSADRIIKIIELLNVDGEARRMNIWHNNLASVYSLCNCVPFQRRKDILKKSISYADQGEFTYGKAFAYKHLADTYRDEGIYDSTLYYLEQIEVLLPEINKPDFTGLVSVAQGSYWSSMKNNRRAIPYFKKAYNIWEQLGKKKDQMSIAMVLNDLYSSQNNFESAYKYLNVYVGLRDSIYSEEKIRQVKELEMTYDFRQKQTTDSLKSEEKLSLLSVGYEYEAALQKRSYLIMLSIGIGILIIACITYYSLLHQKKLSKLLEVKSRQVETELQQKELLLAEIHHRVKNNFQILSSLLELQSKGVEDEATKELISEGKNRVRSMALIHNQLYNTDSLTIYLSEYLHNLVSEIQRSFDNSASEVVISVAEEYTVDIDTMVPLGLIANELVTNSFKYAFQSTETLSLKISLSKNEGFDLLTVRDNGPGLPNAFDIKKTKSTGIWLVSRLALQLHGHYEYEYDNGAVFRIYFKQSEFIGV